MICLRVQEAFVDYLKSINITDLDSANIFPAFSKGRKTGEVPGESQDEEQFFVEHEKRMHPMIVCNCDTATPIQNADPRFLNKNYIVNVTLSLHVKVHDTSSDQFRNMAEDFESAVYFSNNQLARKVVSHGLNNADNIMYQPQTFAADPESNTWIVTATLSMIAG